MSSSTPSASTAAAGQRPAISPAANPQDNTLSDRTVNAKEEPVDLEYDEAGDSEDRTGLEGSIKRPRLRLSQACEHEFHHVTGYIESLTKCSLDVV